MPAKLLFLIVVELCFLAVVVVVEKTVDFPELVALKEIPDALLIDEEQLRDQGNELPKAVNKIERDSLDFIYMLPNQYSSPFRSAASKKNQSWAAGHSS